MSMSMSMSSTPTASATDSASTPTDTSGSDDSGGGGSNASSSLYLFTFLATLFLLLFVSCAIILRSFILRRRFRQRVEAAILAGVLHPSHGIYLGNEFSFGEKPKMWDAWAVPAPLLSTTTTGNIDEKGKEGNGWGDIMPVSVTPISSSNNKTSSSPSDGNTSNPISLSQLYDQHRHHDSSSFLSRVNPFSRRSPTPTLASSSSTPLTPPAPNSDISNPPNDNNNQPEHAALPAIQVSVLIAMPSPNRPFGNNSSTASLPSSNGNKGKERKASTTSSKWTYEEEQELPEMVFGVTTVAQRVSSQGNVHGKGGNRL